MLLRVLNPEVYMTRYPLLLPAAALLSLATSALVGQTASGCPAPPAILKSTQPNIFSDQQEQWLGDAMSDQVERQYKPLQDVAQNAYLQRIVTHLLAVLPHTDIQFHVLLLDSSEVNAFSLAGGRVYITRKLVANAHSEDEIAGVIAHEMGHILTHQFAYETTADLKRLLNITSVTDKADVYAKFEQLSEARLTDKHPGPGGDTDDKQNQADTIAVYATATAGYRPQAFSEFWDRMFFVGGKTGGTMSDFFGTTTPESKRLRAILKLVSALPPGCGGTQPSATPEFQAWQSLVLAHQTTVAAPEVKPVAEVTLTPPLRTDIERLRFSRDGQYILAQDESSISVLTRDPYKLVFHIDAENAQPAEFSPDSQRIVFHTIGLHTEEWSVTGQKLIASHDPVSRDECLETRLSPDGRTLFCISVRYDADIYVFDLSMLDAATGNLLYQKKSFFEPTANFLYRFAVLRMRGDLQELIPASFSADGNVLLLGPASDKLAFDLRTRALLPIGGGLKSAVSGAYAFLGNDKVVGVNLENVKDSGVFSFPDGKLVQPVPFGLTDLESVTSGNFVLSHNINGFAIGVADIAAAKFIGASKAPSMDVWNGWLLNENADGTVLLHKIGDKTAPDQPTMLPLTPLGPRILAVPSADSRLLAISTHTRAGVWDLRTGSQIFLSHRFNSATFAPDDSLYVELPEIGKQPRAIHHISFAPFAANPLPYKEDDDTHLSYGLLQEWKPGSRKSVQLIVHNIADNSVLWTRNFDAGKPDYTPNLVPGQTILGFSLKSDFAKARIKAVPTLATQAAAVKSREQGTLLQLLDNSTGNILREVVFEAPARPDGLDGVNIAGDSLYVTSADNRTIVYSMATGAQLRQFFGAVITIDPSTRRVCMLNRRDEAIAYDEQGREIAAFRMGSAVRFAVFDRSNHLLVLTADQRVRTMDLKAASAETTSSLTQP
jgi:hypothetical protein